MPTDPPTPNPPGDAAHITGDVHIERGDFVARDKLTFTEETAYTVHGLANP
jgi:hypothetical protein